MPGVRKRLLYARDEHSKSLVSHAGGHQDHASVRAALAGPLPQKRLEVPYVGGHEDVAIGCGKLENLTHRSATLRFR